MRTARTYDGFESRYFCQPFYMALSFRFSSPCLLPPSDCVCLRRLKCRPTFLSLLRPAFWPSRARPSPCEALLLRLLLVLFLLLVLCRESIRVARSIWLRERRFADDQLPQQLCSATPRRTSHTHLTHARRDHGRTHRRLDCCTDRGSSSCRRRLVRFFLFPGSRRPSRTRRTQGRTRSRTRGCVHSGGVGPAAGRRGGVPEAGPRRTRDSQRTLGTRTSVQPSRGDNRTRQLERR